MIIVTQAQLRNKDTKAIISVRHNAIDEAIDKCNNLSNENNYIMSYLLRGGYIG